MNTSLDVFPKDREYALLGETEPAAFEIGNPNGTASLVIVADHAARRTPQALGNLGLAAEHFDTHIATDIGTHTITRALAERLDARAVMATYSRLVVDLNRAPDDPEAIPALSDKTPIPGNRNLSPHAARQRIESLHVPYHDAITQQIDALWHRDGTPPTLVSIHSFTPMLNGKKRPWDVGVLWNRDSRLAAPLIEHLRQRGDLNVGDNEPYSGRELAYTINRHGAAHGAANCAVEVRQDHCTSCEQTRQWADILSEALRPVLRGFAPGQCALRSRRKTIKHEDPK